MATWEKRHNQQDSHSANKLQGAETQGKQQPGLLPFSSSHLHFGASSGYFGDVAHDVLGSHSLPGTTFTTEEN